MSTLMSTRISSRRTRRHTPSVAALALVAMVALAGCSGSSDGDSGGSEAADMDVPTSGEREFSDTGSDTGSDTSFDTGSDTGSDPGQDAAGDGSAIQGGSGGSVVTPVVQAERSVISTAVVSLRSDDAGAARTEVMKIVDVHRGQVSDEETRSDDDGAVQSSRLVLRIPAADFAETVAELEKVADLESSDKSSEDVSFQVIDLRARIRAQEQSLRRVEVLLERAQSIRDIVSIESQLTQRQAELESLKTKQAYLADQTTYATITVYIAKHDTKAEPKPKDTDDSGFLSGFEGGWKALGAFATVLATILGALLPWLVVLAIIGWPTWLVSRRLVRRKPAPLTD
jgi:hypothetical protein